MSLAPCLCSRHDKQQPKLHATLPTAGAAHSVATVVLTCLSYVTLRVQYDADFVPRRVRPWSAAPSPPPAATSPFDGTSEVRTSASPRPELCFVPLRAEYRVTVVTGYTLSAL